MEPEQQTLRLEQELAVRLAQILGADADNLNVSTSIDVLGLDSLMLTDLQVWITRSLDINLPLIKLLKGPSITTLATDLRDQMDDDNSPDASSSAESEQVSPDFTLADLDGIDVLNPWLIRGSCNRDAPVRLICFHSMGVGASLFRSFLLNPPDNCDILAVQTPGRENRRNEPVAESVAHLADQILQQLLPLFDRPVVFWGHSFGGIVAREVIRRLRDNEHCQPAHFVVTGTIAPHLIDRWKNREVILKSVDGENSAEYLISLSRYVDDENLLRKILPGLRRDYPLLTSYRFQDLAPLDLPITAFAAQQDEVVYTDEIEGWADHTEAGFELIAVDGDHWFLNRNRDLIVTTLEDIAARIQRQARDRLAVSPTR